MNHKREIHGLPEIDGLSAGEGPSDKELFNEALGDKIAKPHHHDLTDDDLQKALAQLGDTDDAQHAIERIAYLKTLVQKIAEISSLRNSIASDSILGSTQVLLDFASILGPHPELGDLFQTVIDMIFAAMEIERDTGALVTIENGATPRPLKKPRNEIERMQIKRALEMLYGANDPRGDGVSRDTIRQAVADKLGVSFESVAVRTFDRALSDLWPSHL